MESVNREDGTKKLIGFCMRLDQYAVNYEDVISSIEHKVSRLVENKTVDPITEPPKRNPEFIFPEVAPMLIQRFERIIERLHQVESKLDEFI